MHFGRVRAGAARPPGVSASCTRGNEIFIGKADDSRTERKRETERESKTPRVNAARLTGRPSQAGKEDPGLGERDKRRAEDIIEA